jgi:hypothetical protein
MKTIRENEPNVSLRKDKFSTKDLSTVVYAIIRRLNYLYDVSTNEDRKREILEKKAYLMVKLLLVEEK